MLYKCKCSTNNDICHGTVPAPIPVDIYIFNNVKTVGNSWEFF